MPGVYAVLLLLLLLVQRALPPAVYLGVELAMIHTFAGVIGINKSLACLVRLQRCTGKHKASACAHGGTVH